tara:strand:+ start:291 stop:539 length:249 start_codon:yes stop_codon:yes gene_type:complete
MCILLTLIHNLAEEMKHNKVLQLPVTARFSGVQIFSHRSGPQKLDTPISVVPVKLPARQHHNTGCLACAGQVIGGAAQRYKS